MAYSASCAIEFKERDFVPSFHTAWAHKRPLIRKSELPLSEKLKTWNSAAPPPPTPAISFATRADPGSIRHPRSPDSQFLAPFRLRHPIPLPTQTVALWSNLEHVAAGRNPEISVFQIFGARKRSSENTSGYIGTITEPIPERIHFISDISG